LRLKLDENLAARGLDLLLQAGHDVTTVQQQGLTSASDSHLLRVCAAEERGLVTLDLDFANTLLFNPRDHAGIVVLRFKGKVTRSELRRRFLLLIEGLSRGTVAGCLWVVDSRRIRIFDPTEDA
jgi:predicted nuclease of predicted toxin-antitoxin system